MRSAAGRLNRITQTAHLKSRAVDYSARPDRRIYAPEAMTVTEARPAGQCGNLLRAKGKTGTHSFCHLASYKVRVGQRVSEGQVIGIMGYSGYTIPSGPAGRHLHWYIMTSKGYVYPPTLYKTSSKGEIMDTNNKVQSMYYLLRGKKATTGEVAGHRGKTYQSFAESKYTKLEVDNRTRKIASLKSEASQTAAVTKRLATATDSLNKSNMTIKEVNRRLTGKQAEIDELSDANANLGRANTVLARANETLEAQVGESDKWTTFKALIRELFNFTKK